MHLLMSRGVRNCTKFAASGPEISTCRSPITGQIATSSVTFQYSSSGVENVLEIYVRL